MHQTDTGSGLNKRQIVYHCTFNDFTLSSAYIYRHDKSLLYRVFTEGSLSIATLLIGKKDKSERPSVIFCSVDPYKFLFKQETQCKLGYSNTKARCFDFALKLIWNTFSIKNIDLYVSSKFTSLTSHTLR